MVYRTHHPWYFEPPTHGILTPLPMAYRTLHPWHIDPPYPWYFDFPTNVF